MLINCVTPNLPLELAPSGNWPPSLRRQESLSSTRGSKELKRLPAFRAACRIGQSENCGWGGTVSYTGERKTYEHKQKWWRQRSLWLLYELDSKPWIFDGYLQIPDESVLPWRPLVDFFIIRHPSYFRRTQLAFMCYHSVTIILLS